MAGSSALWQAQDKTFLALGPHGLGSVPSTTMVLRPSLALVSSPGGWLGEGGSRWRWLEKDRKEENSSLVPAPAAVGTASQEDRCFTKWQMHVLFPGLGRRWALSGRCQLGGPRTLAAPEGFK